MTLTDATRGGGKETDTGCCGGRCGPGLSHKCSIGLVVVTVILCTFSVEARVIAVSGTDSEAVSAAIVQASPGDVVSLPAGQIALHNPLLLKSSIVLEGTGQGKTILVSRAESPSAMLCLDDCENTEVRALTLDADRNPRASQGVSASRARSLRLHHLTICNFVKSEAFGPHGIVFAGASPTREGGVTDSEIADCRIEHIAPDAAFGAGIRLSWGSSRNRILRNTISDTGRGGIFADNGSTDNIIRGNVVTGSHGEGLGIEVWGGSDRSVIEDNHIDHWLSVGCSDYCAVRRNVIRDRTGEYKFCGIEEIGSHCVITGNTVDGGQRVGVSVSGPQPKQYFYWANNKVTGCNQWGSQFQGEAGGVAFHYLFRCEFRANPVGVGPVQYPGAEGHGFRLNGNCRDMEFEECTFADNGRFGIEFVGKDIDRLRFSRCTITGNGGHAVSTPDNRTRLEWNKCTVTGNADDALPESVPFGGEPPRGGINAPTHTHVGEAVRFTCTESTVLWDFDDGVPSSEPNAEHTYSTPGRKRVTAIVWDREGRARRIEHELEVH